MAPEPLLIKKGWRQKLLAEKSVSGCRYPRNLRPRFFFPFGPWRRADAGSLTAGRKGSKPFCECAMSCFSLVVLNFFLHELLEGIAGVLILSSRWLALNEAQLKDAPPVPDHRSL